LKPSQRKVIFACIKKNLYSEIKVSQLSGYVSEVSSYHHGEASLQDTIINLAQNFVGSNNVNLLEPVGQFGSRLFGGKDSASPRYIFTNLSKNFKELFNPDDFNLLEYLDDDGFSIEPRYYVPNLPLILINGAKGIGTGFSTDIPCFNPKDIKDRLLKLVENEDCEIEELTPWYKGFTGKILKSESNKWTTHGVYEVKSNKILITELPIGTWTEDYKIFLDKLETEETIYSYKNNSTDTTVNFELSLPLEIIVEWTNNGEIEKKLKLMSHISAKNMYVFDENNKIVKMESAEEIVYRFWRIRNEYYLKRQNYIIKKIKYELDIITSKNTFINDVIYENIKVFRQPLDFINSQLEMKKYPKIEDSYKYLTDMKIHSFSKDAIDTLNGKKDSLENEFIKIKNFELKDFWNNV
jgi:DNA topoisomerase-2